MESCNKESKLSELSSRVDVITGKISRNIEKLGNINDTLLGSIPECVSDSKEMQQSRAGSIGILEDMVDNAERRIDIMTSTVDRLKDSSII